MNFQWILLALFLVFLISETVKALYKPMLKNILRLVCVPVAFVITYVIQACGLFQLAATKIIGLLNVADKLGSYADMIDYLIAFASTLLSPTLFVFVFFVIFYILKVVHVNLVASSIQARINKQRRNDLKKTIKQEKEMVKKAIIENDKLLEEGLENGEEDGENVFSISYRGLNDDEIEALVEKRVKADKETKTKTGFFAESSEHKIVSVIVGAVSGILIFGVTLMPLFYTMDILSSATESIKNSDADDSSVYQIVDVLDDNIVTPYKESFVIQFYDSTALIDLIKSSVRTSAKIELEDGSKVYADDVIRTLLTHGVSAAAQLTSQKTEYKSLGDDIKAITANPLVASILSNAISERLVGVSVPEVEEGNMVSESKADFIEHYKNASTETISEDIAFISDAVVLLAKNGMLSDILNGESVDFDSILSDEEKFAAVVEAMSGVSAFEPIMSKLIKSGIENVGESLKIAYNDAEAYDAFVESLLEVLNKYRLPSVNMSQVNSFVKGCAESESHLVFDYAAYYANDADSFVEYLKRWSDIQNVFMNASEDKSLAYFTMEIDGQLYILDMGNISGVEDVNDMKKATLTAVADEAAYGNKISPLSDLINYLICNSCSITDINTDGLSTILTNYISSTSDSHKVCKDLAASLLNKDSFISKGVTVEKMLDSLDFEDWTREKRKNDAGLCVSIITSFLDISENIGSSEDSDIDTMLDQFVALGRVMDLMTKTNCMNELPPLMLEGLVKTGSIGEIMTPAIVNQIVEKVQSNENLSYEGYMKSLSDTFKIAIS